MKTRWYPRRGWLLLRVPVAVFLAVLLVAGCGSKFKTAGKIAMKRQDWDKAIHDLNLALQTDSTDAETHRLLATCYEEKGSYRLMLEHLDAADRFDPEGKEKTEQIRENVWKPLFNSGLAKVRAEDYEGAEQDFRLAVIVQPRRYEAYTNLGYVWQHLDNIDSAYYYYEKAYQLQPDNIRVLESFANLCLSMGKYDRADSLYGKVLGLDPSNSEALLHRGDIANQKGQFQSAIDFYTQALELAPDKCDVWFNLGVIYFQKTKQAEEAQKAFTRAVELCPDDINARINLNIALITLNKLDEAVERLQAFTEKFPDECVGWDLLSQALLRKGLRKQAVEANNRFEECSKE